MAPKVTTEQKAKAVIAGGGATAAAAPFVASKLASKKKTDKYKKEPSRARTRYAADAKDTKIKTAQIKIDELKKIKPSNLSQKNVKARNALIQQQKEIVKGLTKTSAKELAKKYGLASIPVVGAFIATAATALSSTPAGQGSARFGPGSKKNK